MNIQEVIAAHMAWKDRLQKAIDAKAAGQPCPEAPAGLNPHTIVLDNQCILGKWIYNEGLKYARTALYFEVKKKHKEFHLHAGQIAQCVCDCEYAQAQELLTHGKYAETSTTIVNSLEKLGKMVDLWENKEKKVA